MHSILPNLLIQTFPIPSSVNYCAVVASFTIVLLSQYLKIGAFFFYNEKVYILIYFN